MLKSEHHSFKKAGRLSVGRYNPEGQRDRGEAVVFAPDEVVRLREASTSVVVQVIGAAAPAWVEPCSILDRSPTVELVILSEAPWTQNPGSVCPPRLLAFSPGMRWIAYDESLTEALTKAEAMPPATLHVAARAYELDTVALALAAFARGEELLLGACLKDLSTATEVVQDSTAEGQAVVVEGLGDDSVGCRLRASLGTLTAAGYDGGRLLFQLLSPSDFPTFTLRQLVACIDATRACDRGGDMIASATFADRNAVVLIAFRRPIITAAMRLMLRRRDAFVAALDRLIKAGSAKYL